DAQGHWSNCWRCDVIAEHAASKTVYFLLTNARTLFSLVVPVADQKIESLVSVLSQLLAREVARIKPEIKLPTTGTFGLVRGQPRSLIGSQNELTRFALELFHSPDPSLDRLCRKLNRIPMTAIEEVFPEDAFKKCLAADPPSAAAPGNSAIPLPRLSANSAARTDPCPSTSAPNVS